MDMTAKKSFSVSINGQKAVEAGYAFQSGFCYRQIRTHGRVIGQLEVVIDEEGEFNGIPNKWVTVAWIKTGEDVKRVLNALAKIGFSGCSCYVSEDTTTGCYTEEKELFCCII